MKSVIAVIGPTASGKSAVALELARRLGGEIVSCDSMQIYKKLDIGTAKPTAEERDMVVHHLVDMLDPSVSYSVSSFTEDAARAIEDIKSRGKLPIICGGTGLYYSTLVKGIDFTDTPATDEKLREQIKEEARVYGLGPLIAEINAADPEHADRLEVSNPVRVMRSVELLRLTGMTVAQQTERSLRNAHPMDVDPFLLTYEDRSILYGRINERVDRMVDEGILNEARLVYDHRDEYKTAAAAIGYKEFFPYLEGREDLAACTEKLKQASRNYAKRQITWFRREDATRITMDGLSAGEAADIIIERLKGAQDEI